MQAIILAAGMGKRLKELTQDSTKCMVKVNGVSLIERMLYQLDQLSLSRIILVVGYKAESLIAFISELPINTPIMYVQNDIYYKTNNIFSLFLAKDYLMQEDTILLESDLIFEDAVLQKLLQDSYSSLALVAKYESWMDGTVVVLDQEHNIKEFLGKKDFRFEDIPSYYKTVNIYKFSKNFSCTHYVPFLEAYCKALGNNEYYEQVLKVITLLDKPDIKALVINEEHWYEIDDVQDLDIAESIFAMDASEKLKKMQRRYGGYWRYPQMMDYCYLVNPFFPPKKLMDEIKASFERLLINYPSGQEVNALLAAKYFDLSCDSVVVGNGAAELIKLFLEKIEGNLGVVFPTFEEYPNRKKEVIEFFPLNKDFSYTAEDIVRFFDTKDIKALVLINPDNPSGNYIPKKDIFKILEWVKKKNIIFILDESFVDFANADECATFFDQEVLSEFPGLVVVKSISKSFGVPGLRLGVLASADKNLIKEMKKDISIWNINSFGEFFLQIFEKYQSDYQNALKMFKHVRQDFIEQLRLIPKIGVLPTEANFLMCEVKESNGSARMLTQKLLEEYNILIKDLSDKKGIEGEYIRLAIKTKEENDCLILALKQILC